MEESKNEEIKKHLKEIQYSIFSAKSHYTIWKTIFHSRNIGVVSESLAQKYSDAQNTAPAFFVTVERSSLATFVIYILQSFDENKQSHSFFQIDTDATNNFIKNDEKIFNALRRARNKVFAHNDIKDSEIEIPSVVDLDSFFERLFTFYNKQTSEPLTLNSLTIFDMSTNDLLEQMELMFINITRGVVVGKAENDIRLT